MKKNTKKLVYCAALCALAIVLVLLIRFPIFPGAPFLEYDMADVPIFIGTLLFGPFAGILMTFVVSLLQGILLSQASGWVGIVMHFFATGSFVAVAGLIASPSLKKNALSLALGSITMILMMLPLNLIFSSFFYLKCPLNVSFINTLKMFFAFPKGIFGFASVIFGIIAFLVCFLYCKKTKKHIAYGIASGIIFMLLIMLPINIIFGKPSLPTEMQQTLTLIWSFIVPFNAIKAFGNSIIAFIVFSVLKKAIKLPYIRET